MYALRRGGQWITAPEGDGPADQVIPPVLAVSSSAEHAWLADCLDLAIERATLLRLCWGWAAEVRAIR